MTVQALKFFHKLKQFAPAHDKKHFDVVEQALEEVEQYRALGTVEELKEAREKQVAKKPISKEKPYSKDFGLNGEYYCPSCNSYVGYFTEGMNEPEQMEYCNECGQHIAKDWSEEDD